MCRKSPEVMVLNVTGFGCFFPFVQIILSFLYNEIEISRHQTSDSCEGYYVCMFILDLLGYS